jgi:site-specific recombinase XerD
VVAGEPRRALDLGDHGVTFGQLDRLDYFSYELAADDARVDQRHRRMCALNAFFAWLEAEGDVNKNPTRRVRHVPRPRQEPHALDRKQQRRLLREVERVGRPAAR